MEGICFPQVMTQQSRFGIWDKVISFTLYTDTRVHLPLLLSRHAVIISQQVAQTLSSWFGRVTLRKPTKNSSKILEPSKDSMSKSEELPLSLQEDLQPPRKPLAGNHLLERLPTLLLLNLKWGKELPPTWTIKKLKTRVLEEAVKSLPKPWRRSSLNLILSQELFTSWNRECQWTKSR